MNSSPSSLDMVFYHTNRKVTNIMGDDHDVFLTGVVKDDEEMKSEAEVEMRKKHYETKQASA